MRRGGREGLAGERPRERFAGAEEEAEAAVAQALPCVGEGAEEGGEEGRGQSDARGAVCWVQGGGPERERVVAQPAAGGEEEAGCLLGEGRDV